MQRLSELLPGVLVATADQYTTTSTVVTSRDAGCLVIDPAVTVADLAALASDLASAGLRAEAGFATHPHWDHILWSADLGAVPRYASPACAVTAQSERAEMISQVGESAPGHDLGLFGELTALPEEAHQIPWEGPVAQVIVHDGHAPGHAAVFFPDLGVLVAGDMLSDIEIPLLDYPREGALADYRAGLELLAAVPGVRWLVPGHGHAGDAQEYRRRVDNDLRYLDLLGAGTPFDDPRTGTAQWIASWHVSQLAAVSGRSAQG
jgi:hydroxyacylglutathione hydrolase